MTSNLPRIPLNQEELYSRLSSGSEDEGRGEDSEEDAEDAEDFYDAEDLSNKSRGPFQTWFEDDCHVEPDKRIAYLIMMITTIDETFNWEAPPFNQQKKKILKPTLKLYQQELKRRDSSIGVKNKKLDVILALLRGKLRLTDAQDIAYVNEKIGEYTAQLLEAEEANKPQASSSARHVSRKPDRMRFVEAMTLDSVKPYYLKIHEVMTRHELDGRKSTAAEPNFYDRVSEAFNDASYVPSTRIIPDLHYEFATSVPLPLTDYSMTPDRAKALLASMKPKIAKIVSNYEQSGNGDGMRRDDDDGMRHDDDDNPDDDDDDPQQFHLRGDDRGSFLGTETTDLLYWWHVLEDEGMLRYTLAVLPDSIAVTSESTPSVLTTPGSGSSSAVKNKNQDRKLEDMIGSLSKNWERDNALKEQSIAVNKESIVLQRDKMDFERDSFKQKISLEQFSKVRELEREIEGMEDELDKIPNGEQERYKHRLEDRIEKLKDKIARLGE